MKSDSNLRPRARQNVIFEHGYLLAKLGRNRVTLVVDNSAGEIETPNDISGIVYNSRDSFQLSLVKELKDAGFSVSADALI
ncbi:nucleotide-binding protein [Parashewanella spongiae]|nr:nucleotide-binding protein [Parashewanella spongiae]